MRFGILVLGLVLAACGSSAADSGGASGASGAGLPGRGCGTVGARTLAAGRGGRVYERGGVVFGCAFGSRRAVRLGQSRTCLGMPRVGPVRVAGSLVAYGSQQCGVDTGLAAVIVRRLSDGRVLRTLPALDVPLGPESYRSVASVVLESGGAVAWVGVGTSILSHRRQLEVLAADTRGRVRRLDQGGAIQAGSLALHGSRVTWRDGGGTRSASL